MIELKDTAYLMMSDNWKWRLIAEYTQAYIRHEKLACHLDKAEQLEDIGEMADTFTALNDYCYSLRDRLAKIYPHEGLMIIKGWIDQDVSFEEMLEDLHVLEKQNR